MTPKQILLTIVEVALSLLGEKGALLRDDKMDQIFKGIKNAKTGEERLELLKELNNHLHRTS